MSLLSVEDLKVSYGPKGRSFNAVDGVSFTVEKGETIGVVGESGCGKSTLGKSILRLIETAGGTIRLDGEDITGLGHQAMMSKRRRMQMVFQDPFGSLNPRQSIGKLLDTPMRAHGIADKAERQKRIEYIIDKVGLPQTSLTRFPHEFSGGQRQRIGIARALILRPDLLICDEPVSALDLSIQSQILNLLTDLKAEFSLSYLFISHDLSVVRYFADRVIVMYLGRVVETADHETLWRDPRHPYTRALLAAVPIPRPGSRKHDAPILGERQSAAAASAGCRFYQRCPMAQNRCATEEPVLRSVDSGHGAACHYA
ncbi:ATP-binding cassette domain-containing protein [Neorhizobium lilium]|uniref:ATP-binding cassette domain-containing protein n=1 Tax=Neorhizobium lilium TaxID=2503024 RepID=A0A3S3RPN9_9HYPH|nr:oligopeptide/dipeptide ABC transporter ATP-binding protein [Neorhizobium lilium]RWX74785.1 ATP-binding cassette domain-containing protein [Neorhizobium lilium]